jgi:hypothetical protein
MITLLLVLAMSNFSFGFQDDGRLRSGDYTALDQGRAIGGKALRLIIARDKLKRKGGGYDFSVYDNIVNHARLRGIHPQIVLDNRSGSGMGDPKKYAEFVKAAGVHFKGRVGTYSLINEPNEKMSPDKYRQLYVRGQRALIGVDKQARVLFGELSPHHTMRYAQKVIGKRGLTASGFAWHPYQSTDPLSANADLGSGGIGRLNTLNRQIAGLNLKTRAGKTPGSYLTEFGYGKYAGRNVDAGQAAAYWPRALRKARQAGARQVIAYTMTGNPEQAWDTGLIGPNNAPRPAYGAIKASSRYTR